MKIAFITYYPKETLKKHHGNLHFILKALLESGHEIVMIDNLSSKYQDLYKIKSFYHKHLTKKSYFRLMDIAVTKNVGKQATQKLKEHKDIDLVLATGSIEMSYLQTDLPSLLWTDTPFVGLLDYYSNFQNLPKKFTQNVIKFDKLAHEKSKYIIYPSQWAIDIAKDKYSIASDKLIHIGFGASIDSELEINSCEEIISKRLESPLTLFFAAIEWERKGGKIIFEALEKIKSEIPDVKLKIAGFKPEVPSSLINNVEIIPFLNKNNPDDFRKMQELYMYSHFFIMPSYAETFGVVFAEAASYALPVISSNSGGIPSVVKNEVNGYTFDIDNNIASEISKKVIELYNNKSKYSELCRTSFQEYHSRLSWKASAKKFNELIETISS